MLTTDLEHDEIQSTSNKGESRWNYDDFSLHSVHESGLAQQPRLLFVAG
jgi:hypothetical protein